MKSTTDLKQASPLSKASFPLQKVSHKTQRSITFGFLVETVRSVQLSTSCMRYSLSFSKEQVDLKAELDTSYLIIPSYHLRLIFKQLDVNWPQDMVKRKFIENKACEIWSQNTYGLI